MFRRATLAVVGVALAAGVLLTGCTGPQSVADRVNAGYPESLAESDPAKIPFGQPLVAWLDDGARFALVTWGSSSCPAVVTRIETVSAAELELRVERSGGSGPCTADMAATTHEFSVPDGVTVRPLTVTLTWPESDEATQLTLD